MIQNEETSGGNRTDVAETILGVIRGDLPLGSLTDIGIHLVSNGSSYKLESGNFDLSVRATPLDLAVGILKYESRSKAELRKWAFFILGECGAVDFAEIESDPRGEVLISALWDATFEGTLNNEVLALAESITREADEKQTS